MPRRSITDEEIGLIKAMLRRGMRNRDIQFYFNRQDRPVNSGRITGIRSGDYGPEVPEATDAELDAFLATFAPAEVGVVIGRTARNVPAARAHEYVLGLTCVNDVTDRDLQRRDVQYTRAKGFDTFAPVGPCIAACDLDRSIAVESRINGVRRQHSSTRELIFPIRRLVEFVTAVMTLLPGDIISTGTPPGVGPIVPGDRVVITVEGVGELVNDVVAASEAAP